MLEDESSTQLQMQAEVGLALLVDERTSIRVDVGQDGVGEAFGLAYLLPAQGWVRAGRLTPNYGWKFADHQLYARRFVLAKDGVRDPSFWESAGMEIGLAPGSAMLTASLDDGGGPGTAGPRVEPGARTTTGSDSRSGPRRCVGSRTMATGDRSVCMVRCGSVGWCGSASGTSHVKQTGANACSRRNSA